MSQADCPHYFIDLYANNVFKCKDCNGFFTLPNDLNLGRDEGKKGGGNAIKQALKAFFLPARNRPQTSQCPPQKNARMKLLPRYNLHQ